VDDSEIVVTGKRGKAMLQLILGRDTLGRCSSIAYERARKMLVLRCA
jgi:hypothetical protein